MSGLGVSGLGVSGWRAIGAIALFWCAVGLIQTFNWGSGVPKAIVMLALLIAAPFVMAAQKSPLALEQSRPTVIEKSGRFARAITIACGIALALNLAYLAARIIAPHVIDIATTTLAAGQALVHGGNPYKLPIDTGPEAAGFTGYKYLPVMIAGYLPLGLPLGQRGILLTNLIVLLASAALMKRLGRSALAPLLLLSLPLVAEQLFAKGATDLLATLPLLGALALGERRPFLSGLCLGLSLATKLLPGAAMFPALIPARQRGHYATGVAAGLLPLIPFLLAGPRAFFGNIVLFNLSRSADATSWLHDAPPVLATAAHGALAVFILGAALYVWQRTPGVTLRCGLAAMLGLAAILAGPGAHHNYQLWWLPFYGVLIARVVAPVREEACQETPFLYTSAAD